MLFLLLAIDGASGQMLRKGPYLIYAGVNTRMDVLWQGTTASIDTIDWGLDLSYGVGSDTSTAYGDSQHRYTIHDLVPGLLYQYRIKVMDTVYAGSFRAAPPQDESTVHFFAYGDTRTYPAIHNRLADSIVASFSSNPGLRGIILVVGDLVSDGNQESAWTNELFGRSYTGIAEMMANLPYISCMGNHEGAGVLFRKYFPYPFVGSRYWSFDYGLAHFVILDQYTSYNPGSAQYI